METHLRLDLDDDGDDLISITCRLCAIDNFGLTEEDATDLGWTEIVEVTGYEAILESDWYEHLGYCRECTEIVKRERAAPWN
jgi:hypothetical protein